MMTPAEHLLNMARAHAAKVEAEVMFGLAQQAQHDYEQRRRCNGTIQFEFEACYDKPLCSMSPQLEAAYKARVKARYAYGNAKMIALKAGQELLKERTR